MTHPLHPAQLRASAALWSLRTALAKLDARDAEEARAIAAEQAEAVGLLKSPSWGRRHALGGHGDPTGDALLAIYAPAPARPNRFAQLANEAREQLHGVAQHLPSVGGFDLLARFETAIPTMSTTAAAATRKLLDRIDGRIRRLLHFPGDGQLVPRIPCPACDTTGLVMRTSAPRAQQVVECTACDAAWLRSEMVGSGQG